MIKLEEYPREIQAFLRGATLYDSSYSEQAKVIYVDKDCGFFLKSAAKGSLAREAAMTEYFHGLGLAAEVLTYVSDVNDWLLTTNIEGDSCIAARYLEQPERLVDIMAEQLLHLHKLSFQGCPVPNHTELYLAKARENHHLGIFDKYLFNDNWAYASADEAWAVIEKSGHHLQTDTLLHGDYCLPNIILNNWHFSGFVDLDSGGVGDRHVDVFWALWTLVFNLKTDRYHKRFIDAYGRDRVNEDALRVIAAIEVFS